MGSSLKNSNGIEADDVIAMLEEQPYITADLATVFGVSEREMLRACLQMQKRWQIRRASPEAPWTIAGVETRDIPTKAPPKREREARRRRAKAGRLGMLGAAAEIDRRLSIVEPVCGSSVCAAADCGKRFTPLGPGDRYCSSACAQRGPSALVRTVIVDGQVFEASSIGSGPVTRAWPSGGSSLKN